MADQQSRIQRRHLLQDAFTQIARLTGVDFNEHTNPQSNSRNNSPSQTSVNEELRLRFPSLRLPTSTTTTINNSYNTNSHQETTPTCPGRNTRPSISGSSTSRSQKNRMRKRKADQIPKIVYKDLVYIPDPDEGQVPTHNARVTLETEGNVVHGFPVDTAWDSRTLKNKICDQIRPLFTSEFEYVKVCKDAFFKRYVQYFLYLSAIRYKI